MNNKLVKKEQIINAENQLTVGLFHGTSTLFLDSIIQHGLGGLNPVVEWKLLELSKEIYELSEQHLKETKLYEVSSISFKKMVYQSNGGAFNFQHGDSYLSPSKQTAAFYAINNKYGSELLSYTINFLKELLNKDIPYVKTDLFRKFPKIFGLIEAKPSPLLIQVENVTASSLLNEHGEDPKHNLEQMQEMMNESKELYEVIMQQTNFRLTKPVETSNLKFWLINVQKWNNLTPQYNLHEINTNEINNKE
jgi:hypothetical protein